MPAKKYIVRLCEEERQVLKETIKNLKGSSRKAQRARILLKADVDGPGWIDSEIAEAFDCSTQSIELIRERLVTRGFEDTLNGRSTPYSSRKKLLSGEQEAMIIAMRLGEPPKGYGHWTLRLLSERIVELDIVDSISHETVRRTLKKMA